MGWIWCVVFWVTEQLVLFVSYEGKKPPKMEYVRCSLLRGQCRRRYFRGYCILDAFWLSPRNILKLLVWQSPTFQACTVQTLSKTSWSLISPAWKTVMSWLCKWCTCLLRGLTGWCIRKETIHVPLANSLLKYHVWIINVQWKLITAAVLSGANSGNFKGCKDFQT